jgi:hypothetical protein
MCSVENKASEILQNPKLVDTLRFYKARWEVRRIFVGTWCSEKGFSGLSLLGYRNPMVPHLAALGITC